MTNRIGILTTGGEYQCYTCRGYWKSARKFAEHIKESNHRGPA